MKFKIIKIILICLGFICYRCENYVEKKPEVIKSDSTLTKVNTVVIDDSLVLEYDTVIIDEELTSVANFIAGIESSTLKDLQDNETYKAYTAHIDTVWKKIEEENLLQIRVWRSENNVAEKEDTGAVFYPFSGPDILYANAFFPDANNYVMIGLEKIGNIPIVDKFKDSTFVYSYLENLLYSLRYTNKVGYFVTRQMQSDFANRNLDGVVHILLFYLARTHHKIVDIERITTDAFGNLKVRKSENESKINGIRIKFTDKDKSKIQSLCYFPFDLSDDNLAKNTEFLFFLNSLGKKITYTKSASYILHRNEFSILRKLILQQSKKILQDDTGIPYELVKNQGFKIDLFGNYTKTITDFKFEFQADLKNDLDSQTVRKYLPFKIGYNAWYNETVLIYAKQKTENRVLDSTIIDSLNRSNTNVIN